MEGRVYLKYHSRMRERNNFVSTFGILGGETGDWALVYGSSIEITVLLPAYCIGTLG